MRRQAPVLLLLMLVAACVGPKRTPEQEAKLIHYQMLTGYTEAVKAVTQWARTGNLSAEDAQKFEEVRAPAKEALDGMGAAIDRGDYGAVEILKSGVENMLVWYLAKKGAT